MGDQPTKVKAQIATQRTSGGDLQRVGLRSYALRVVFSPEQVVIHAHDEAVVVAVWENVLVQYRRGPMTEAMLSHIASLVRATNAKRTGPAGALSLLDEAAPVPDASMRRRQSEVIGALMKDGRNHVAVVTAGQGIASSMMRSVARLLYRGTGRVTVVGTDEEAISWLAERVGRERSDLSAFAQHVRAL